MKKLIMVPVLALSLANAEAQFVQNGGFENWTFQDTTWDGQSLYAPGNWSSAPYNWPELSSDSYSGNSAAVLSPILSCGIMPNFMLYGQYDPMHFNVFNPPYDFTGSGEAITFKPIKLSGHYKLLSFDFPDSASIVVVLKKFNPVTGLYDKVGEGSAKLPPVNAYTRFDIDITDLQPGVTPDSIAIAIVSGQGFQFDSLGNMYLSRLYVDQLWLTREEMTGVEENPLQTEVVFYPNPTRDFIHIALSAPVEDELFLQLTDMNGRILLHRPVVQGSAEGIPVSGLSTGKYIATLLGKTKVYAAHTLIIGEDCVY